MQLPNKKKVAGAVAAILGTVTSSQVIANETQSLETDEVIQVMGIRGSLSKSASIKREASGVVDAISSEDIGKFPDTNLAESLQRITGVSIDRANNEGNQVTVRGFGPSFNLVTLNGRQMPNSSVLESQGISRSFNFREIASETVSGVTVNKTGRANVSSGGIGATIDITTAKPFDYDGFKAFAGVKGIYDTSVEKGDKITPELSGMVSQTFADGKLGVLLSASHSERHSHRDRVGTDGWYTSAKDSVDKTAIDTTKNPSKTVFIPWTATVEHYDTERERQNAQAVIQFSPMDSLVATLDYTLSRFEEVSYTNRMAYWFDDPSGKADSNGTLINPFDPDDELNFWAWQYFEKKENDSLGLNVKWQATDELSFTLDWHDSTSHSNPGGKTAETLANLKNPKYDHDSNDTTPSLGVDIGANFSGDIPAITIDDSKIPGSAYDKANIVSDLYQLRGYEMENNIQQLHLAGEWENFNTGLLSKVKFGVQSTEYQVDTFLSQRFDFVSVPLTDLDISFEPLGDTADQFSGTDKLFPLVPKYSVNQFIDIVEKAGKFNAPNIRTNGITEETTAAYISADLETEVAGMQANINVGARYEQTDITAYSVAESIVAMNFNHDEELRPVYDGVAARQNLTGDYTRFLPNLDVSLNVTDEVVARVSYGKTISRADISAMFPSTTYNARPDGPFRITQGNPSLLPITSDNIDLSLEWYLDDGSYASIGYYRKDVENFIGSVTTNEEWNNKDGIVLTDPSINPRAGCPDSSVEPNPACLSQASDPAITWEVSRPENLQSRTVDGWEFNVQYMFGETGFGSVANYTTVESDETYDRFDFSQTVALTGLSDSANLVGFYENDQLQIRFAYNWRDEFLMRFQGSEPRFVEAYGQWDMNVSYDINDNISVFFDGINLTDETVRRYARFEEQVIDAEQYGPRYTFGVRAKW
ncbi:TonB-dependent receptor [Saccharobesus litoralis]|uniref:TonB-dependent receptor n=2 Tax=Saccharobesus litoralis TaxID=2172099 RepID=A0A2S0VXM8_9ALTE|nr:TonB-dependent receptor [Saccharobesus litoralis]